MGNALIDKMKEADGILLGLADLRGDVYAEIKALMTAPAWFSSPTAAFPAQVGAPGGGGAESRGDPRL